MKKIIPFQKEIAFKSNVAEITSISLENTLKIDNFLITGDFIVSGEYKMANTSINTEKFSFSLPCTIEIDDKYSLDKVVIDVDDFYYEILNDRSLVVNIDVSIDRLEEKLMAVDTEIEKIEEDRDGSIENSFKDELNTEIYNSVQVNSDANYTEDKLQFPLKTEEEIMPINNSQQLEKKIDNNIDIFNSFTDNTDIDNFATYKVCIVREGETIESIMEKYSISKDSLEKYNNLVDMKIGDKLIIPSE